MYVYIRVWLVIYIPSYGQRGKGNIRAQRRREKDRARTRRYLATHPPAEGETIPISIRVPADLLEELSIIREQTGVSVTFQMIKATREYLAKRRSAIENRGEQSDDEY